MSNREKLGLADKISTGDAIFCQRGITLKIVEDGGDYFLLVKKNQRVIQVEITTAFDEPIFSLKESHAPPEAGHGRIEHRQIAILPAEALSEHIRERWPSAQSIVRIDRKREHSGNGCIARFERETVWLITSIKNTDSYRVLDLNRARWGIEIMHRDNKD